jgi:hypothetical protein
MATQTWVQINMYRNNGGRFEYLLLKRIDHDDKFWQVVTEQVPTHGTIPETLRQAALNQVGVRGFKHLSKEMYSYEWYTRGDHGRDIVFAVELDPKTPIKLDSHLYSEYVWLDYKEALLRLKWDGNKQALRRLADHLHKEQLATPATHHEAEGFYEHQKIGEARDAKDKASPVKFRSTSPFTGDIPQRLPDADPRNDQDEDPSTIFLRL